MFDFAYFVIFLKILYNSFIWCHFDHSDTFIFIMILLKPNLEYFKKYNKICKIRHTQCISADCWTLKSYKKGSSHCVKYKIVFELSRYIFWVISRRLNSKLIIQRLFIEFSDNDSNIFIPKYQLRHFETKCIEFSNIFILLIKY